MTDQTQTGSSEQDVVKTEEPEFDVTSVMDEVAATNWKVNHRWEKKGRVYDLKPWIQAKFAEVGRPISTEEIDEFFASRKEAELNTPLTDKEIRKMSRGKESLRTKRLILSADKWLYDQRLGNRPAKLDKRMQEEIDRLSDRIERQLDLQQTQNIFAKVKEERDLVAFGPDGNQVCCSFEGCICQDQPKTRTQVLNGRVLLHMTGPLKGLPKRHGNWGVFGTGEDLEVKPFCHEHTLFLVGHGLEFYPKEDAEKFVQIRKQELAEEKALAERREAEAKAQAERKRIEDEERTKELKRQNEIAEKLLASSPARREKAAYKNVRDMSDSGKLSGKRKKVRKQ